MSNEKKRNLHRATISESTKEMAIHDLKHQIYDVFMYANDITLMEEMSLTERYAFKSLMGDLEDCLVELSCIGEYVEANDIAISRMCQILDAQKYAIDKM